MEFVYLTRDREENAGAWSETGEKAKRALIAMSGGVDSTVSAYLMKDAGYDCVGVTMRLFENTDGVPTSPTACCTPKDVEDAQDVCRTMGMPHFVMNFQTKFRETVIDKFVDAYENGRTPNPCIDCNRYLKFDHLFHKAEDLGCDVIVTGHYARVGYNEETGRYELKKAVYLDKDQSYVLYNLTQDQLAHIQFPLGGITKPEVRDVAAAQGFVNAKKHESQDICFVPTGKYTDFIERYTGKTYPEGDFVDKRNGQVLGRHKGIIRYTVGQRKGLGLALPQPMYVCQVDPVENRVLLGLNDDLFSTTLVAEDFNWVSAAGFPKDESGTLDLPLRCTAKVRYKQQDAPATAYPEPDGKVKVVFDEAQRAITKGQAVVLYDGDTVLGGGTITEVL